MRRTRLMVGATLVALMTSVAAAGAAPSNLRAHLVGAEEVPAADTAAQGQAVFQVDDDGTAIDYRVNVANIDDVLMSHLHLAPAGTNGPIIVWLYPDAPPPQLIEGRTQGTLATGTITADDLTGPLTGASMEHLLEAIRAGTIYVNVHTTAFPGGEIRGQLD